MQNRQFDKIYNICLVFFIQVNMETLDIIALIVQREVVLVLNWAILISKCTTETQDEMLSKSSPKVAVVTEQRRMTSV